MKGMLVAETFPTILLLLLCVERILAQIEAGSRSIPLTESCLQMSWTQCKRILDSIS